MSEIIMPKMGDAMTEGKVVRWHKKAGERVSKGEPVVEIETDKVNLDLEAEEDGTLSGHMAAEGEVVPVGGRLAMIVTGFEKAVPAKAKEPSTAAPEETSPVGEDPQQRRAADRKGSVKSTTGEYAEARDINGPRIDRSSPDPGTKVTSEVSVGGERSRSSPLARKMARELGVSLESVRGSGPRGRIVAEDVRAAGMSAKPSGPTPAKKAAAPALGQPAALEEKKIPLSAMRRTIARRLAESTGPIPHFYLTVDYDVTNLLALRTQLVEVSGAKVSVNDFVVRAAALALRHHPNVNASWGEEAITHHGAIHVGIAVATPEGLITPVVRNTDSRSVLEIAQEVRTLADKAKNRKLMPDDYQGSTLTISNLGAWGIEEFTAIINPPNSAILAVGAAEARAVVIDRQLVIRDRMKITMSCDHRVIDGVAGAEFLKTLRSYIEQPLRLLL